MTLNQLKIILEDVRITINLKSNKEWTSGDALFGELHGGLSFNSGI